ncbi:MAG: beta strand repeat-containing protein, partial [Thermomicrobiales bacterium]
ANGGNDTSAPQTFTITVTLVNHPPSFTKGPDQTVFENAGAQTVNPWATAISPGPPNESGQTVTFNITGNTNAALFSAGPAISPTGVLTYTPATNANGTATITIVLQDNGGGNDTSPPQTFVITVTPVNQPPTFTIGPDQSVLENSGLHTVTGWATNIAPGPPNESGQTVTFNVTGNDNPTLFSAGPAIAPDGTLTYTPATNMSGVAHITIVLQDNGGTANGGVDTSAPQTFTIGVLLVNQPPSFTKGPDQTVLEDAGAQSVAGWATAISPGPPNEVGQTVTLNVTGNTNAALFSAGPAIAPDGTLTYTPAPNANGTATITIVLQDSGGTANGGNDTSAPQTFIINVTAVNDPPTFTGGPNQTVLANAGAQTVVTWATNISAGPPDESGQTLTFTVTNDNNALFTIQPAVDPITGNLTYTLSGTSGTANVTVVLKDSGGTANGGNDTSAPQTFTITVAPLPAVASTTPANGAKNVALNATVTVVFNQAVTVSGGWFLIDCTKSGPRTTTTATFGTADNITYVITPNNPFADGETCTLTVYAANVTGPIGGAHPASDFTSTFQSNIPPTVTGNAPANGALNVPVNTTITVTFSEPVNVTASAFTLECPTGSAVPFAVTPPPPGGTTFTLTPTANLPGGVICTVTVVAAQVTDVDANSAMASNFTFSFTTLPPPVAANDTYTQTVLGNMPVDSTKISFSVLTNDTLNGGTITASDTTSAHGGAVTLNASTGTFTYNPAAGYRGADTFTYTLTNASGSATATVTLNISGMIWFINNNIGTNGDGRFGSPFNALSPFSTINNGGANHPLAGDTIFAYESANPYTGSLTLLDTQRVIGQDATSRLSTLSGLTPPSSSPAFPAMNATAGQTATINGNLVLGSGNSIAGFTLGTSGVTSLQGPSGGSVGTLTINDVTINNPVGQALNLLGGAPGGTIVGNGFVSVTSGSGANNVNLGNLGGTLTIAGGALSGRSGVAFNVSGGAGTVSYAGTISSGAQNAVTVASHTGGTVTFSSTIGGASVNLTSNTGATITFTGKLTLSSGAATAFNANVGGTVTANATGSTLTATTGTALNVANTTIGAAGLTFQSISANGGASGIVLNNTGTSGGLTVTGTGAASSGGTIQNTSSHGIVLTSTKNASFNNMNIQNTGGSGVRGTTAVTNFTFTNGTINNSGTGGGNQESS